VFHQRLDTCVDRIQKTADKAGVEVLFQPQVEERVERVAIAAADDLGDRAVGEAGILRLGRRGDDDAIPVALEDRARLGIAQIVAELLAPGVIAEHRL